MTSKRRLFCSAVAIAALAGGSLIAMGATATAGSLQRHSQRQVELPIVYAGYTDSFRKGTPNTPSPWKGSSGVIFKGCNYFHPDRCPKTKSGKDSYDSGAVRLDNISQGSVSVTNATVVIGSCTFHPWPKLNVTLPAGKTLILTQTGGKPPCHTARSTFNFDSSDTNHSCTPNQIVPVLHVTWGGESLSFLDPSQTLNTGGEDIGKKACGHHNETTDWTRMSVPG